MGNSSEQRPERGERGERGVKTIIETPLGGETETVMPAMLSVICYFLQPQIRL